MSVGTIDVTHDGFLDPRVKILDGAGQLLAVLTVEEFRRRPRPRWRRCPVHGPYVPLVGRFGTTQPGECVRCKVERRSS